MSEQGYYRYATIYGDTIVFACEDDLWAVSTGGGTARRLTAGQGEFAMPKFSPDGKNIAFIGREEGHPEVYAIPAQGGVPRRLTYLGGETCAVSGWSADGKNVLFVSEAKAPFLRHSEAFTIGLDGGVPKPTNLGHVQTISVKENGATVIGRNANDPARWKRYRGGTAGEIWIDDAGDGNYKKLLDLRGNLVWPMWIGDRVYFLSDHEGVGNIYSCTPQGGDLKQHTKQTDYYVRFPSTDGKRIVYTAGGDIYVMDADSCQSIKLEFEAPPITVQVGRRFVEGQEFQEHFAPHPQGHSLGLIARGQPVTMANWEGGVVQHGNGSRSRYRNLEWLADGERFVVVSDTAGYEQLELHYADQSEEPTVIVKGEMGRVIDIRVSPTQDMVAIANHRQELLIVDLKNKTVKALDRSTADRISGLSWSADGRWIAYSWAPHPQSSIIRIAHIKSQEVHDVTQELRVDCAPCFDPEGRYLYFLSARDFFPIYDSLQFDLSFPQSMRPFLVTLRKDVESPFIAKPKPVVEAAAKKSKKEEKEGKEGKEKEKDKDKDEETKKIKIDFEGIENRIVGFPVAEGKYTGLSASRKRVFFIKVPVKGIRPDFNWMNSEEEPGALIAYDLDENRIATFQKEVAVIRMAYDNQTLYYKSRKRIRAINAGAALPGEGAEPSAVPDKAGRSSGWLDLKRVQVLVQPREEWRQMYEEAWRLQSEHFWDAHMSDVDWNLVHDRYAALLPRIRTRSELSDIIWEMQGELGTSHAYEMGGDYRRSPSYQRGFLGADLSWDGKAGGYRIDRIIRGDSWDTEIDSPLAGRGLDVEEGDIIVAVGGRSVSKECSVDELLINSAAKTVNLTLLHKSKKRHVQVKTLKTEKLLRYRHWVETNRKLVHEKSRGKLGYLHIPDMGPVGYAEFHRGFLSEYYRQGMIIDVRYNRGGHVSQLLLQKLLRKCVGFCVSRWGPPEPYPNESIAGPMVALTNQFAGSDGDIFSHCFKIYKLGPLVGKRTWGGVIGISPRHNLVDGTVTTQPEFSFWFADVGWKVENYGTDPDYDVDIAPHHYRDGKDPQMEKGLELALEALKKSPVELPDFTVRPSLPLPSRS